MNSFRKSNFRNKTDKRIIDRFKHGASYKDVNDPKKDGVLDRWPKFLKENRVKGIQSWAFVRLELKQSLMNLYGDGRGL